METPLQLSFEVGGEAPTSLGITFKGTLKSVQRELLKGEELRISVVDVEGNPVIEGIGPVAEIHFKDKIDKRGSIESVERLHIVKLA